MHKRGGGSGGGVGKTGYPTIRLLFSLLVATYLFICACPTIFKMTKHGAEWRAAGNQNQKKKELVVCIHIF